MDFERRYDSDNDRLFLVYYALPPGFNANKWGVTEQSLDRNIQSAVNKPVIIYRKNPSSPFHTHQAGNFVHPTPEEATAELGHHPREEEYYNWQEKFAVGRVRNVDKRGNKGYAFTLEITDPDSKQILQDNKYIRGMPGWTSPQIITNSKVYPEEERSGMFDHWAISHVILTDVPAYGFDKASLKGECFGAEKECLIKTKNASQQNLGFCVKGAVTELIESRSSISESESSPSITMSTQATPQPSSNNNEVVVTKTFSEQNPKQEEGEVPSRPEGPTDKERGDQERSERPSEESEKVALAIDLPKTLEDSHKEIVQLREQIKVKDEMQRSTNKEMKKILAWKDQIETERKEYLLRSIIPRNLFKSDDSYSKEILKITTLGLDKDLDWLKEHYHIMSQAKMAQEQTDLVKPQIKVKSASVQHDVPDYQEQKQSHDNSSLNDKLLNLQRKMLGGQF